MFYIRQENGLTEVVELQEGQEAPEGVEVFDTLEAAGAAAISAADEAFEREEAVLAAELALAEGDAAESDKAAGVTPPAAPAGLLAEAAILTLSIRGNIVAQLENAGYEEHAKAVQALIDAKKG